MTPAARFDIPDRTYRYAAGAIIIVAAVLRFWDLGGPSLWFDEAVYVLNARGSFADVFTLTQTNNSSPFLLPLLLNLIERTVGLNEFTSRLPAALAGIAAVFVMTRLKDVGVPKPVALLSAALLAAGQMQIIYSQEVREYGLSILMSAVLLWSFFRVLNTGNFSALMIALAVTPWASYGPCFAALAVLTTLTFLRVMKRTEVPFLSIGLSVAVFLGSAIASYFAVARHQLGTAQQWYLIEHYFGMSDAGLPEWLATNTGGILLASVPGLLAVIVLPLILAVYLSRYLTKPLALLDEPGIIAAIVLIGGMVLAGLLGLYPYGSPRHSVFIGPFVSVMLATGAVGFLANLPSRYRPGATAGLGALLAVSAIVAILAIPMGAGLHPALAKVGKIEIYGEYEDNRALMNFARQHPGNTLYGTFGAGPARNYYGADMDFIKADGSLTGNPEGLADEIMALAAEKPVTVILSNMQATDGETLRGVIAARGGAVTDTFTAKRVEGFVVALRPAAP